MRRITCLSFAVIAALAVACGSSSSSSSTSSAPASAAASGSAPASVAASGSAPAGSSAAACAAAPAGAAATVKVDYKDFKPSSDPIKAKVGDVIEWTNGDSAPHTATLTDGSCTTAEIAPGTTGALVFTVAGSYTYMCKVHPAQMKDFKIDVQ